MSSSLTNKRILYTFASHCTDTKGIQRRGCMQNVRWKRIPMHRAMWKMMEFLCAVAIKWSRSNDNFETTNAEFRRKKCTKYYEFETRTHTDYTRKLQKVLFIYILPLSFGLFQTEREKSVAHLITFATTLFSVHIRFSNFPFWRRTTVTESAAHKTAIVFSLFACIFFSLQHRTSLFTTWSEYEAKNVLCFCHFSFPFFPLLVFHFVTWDSCGECASVHCTIRN